MTQDMTEDVTITSGKFQASLVALGYPLIRDNFVQTSDHKLRHRNAKGELLNRFQACGDDIYLRIWWDGDNYLGCYPADITVVKL